MSLERPGLAKPSSDVSKTDASSEDYPFAFDDLKDRCSSLTDKILGILSYDSISCPQEIKVSSFRNKATVGMLLIDSAVNEMAFGGPAYNSGVLKRGDRIIRVDGSVVTTAEEIESALLKNDFPGATVSLTIERGNLVDTFQQLEIVLTKMDVSLIADRCQIFHTFALLKEHMIQDNNTRAVEMLDSFMVMISQMILASSNHSERMAAAMQALILEGAAAVHELRKVLDVTFGLCQGTLESSQPLAGSHSGFSSSACSGRQRSSDLSDVSGSSTDDDGDTAPRLGQGLGQGRDPVLYHLKGRSPPVPRLMLEAITAVPARPATQPVSPAPHVPPAASAAALASGMGSASPIEGAGLGPGGVTPAGLFRQADEGHGWEFGAFTPERAVSAHGALWYDADRHGLDVSDLAEVLSVSDAAAARLTLMATENSNLKTQVEQLQRSLAHMVSSDTLHVITAQACQVKAVVAGVSVQLELESDHLCQEIEALEKCLDETLQRKALTDVNPTAPSLDHGTQWQVECFQEQSGKEFLHELSQEMESTEKLNGPAKVGCLFQQNIESGSLLSHQVLPELAAENREEDKYKFAIADADTLRTMHENLLDRPESLGLDAATEARKWRLRSRNLRASLDWSHSTACPENWDKAMKEVEGQVASSQETLDFLQILLTNMGLKLHPVSSVSDCQTVDHAVTGLVTASALPAKINVLLTAGESQSPMDWSESIALDRSNQSIVLQCNDSEEQHNPTLDHLELQESVRFVLAKTEPVCASTVPVSKAGADSAPREELCQSGLEGMITNLVLESSMLRADIDIKETQLWLGIMQVQSSLTEIRLLQERLDHIVPEYELDQAVRVAENLRVDNEKLLNVGTDSVVSEELNQLMSVNDALGAKTSEIGGLDSGIGSLVSEAELDSAKEQVMMLTNMVTHQHVPLENADRACIATSAVPYDQGEIKLSGGRELVWQARWDETFEEVIRQAAANEETIARIQQRVSDMLLDLDVSAVELERVEAILSDRIFVPADVIYKLKADIEIKDAQLHHMTTQIQDGQKTVESMLERMNNMVPKNELTEATEEVDRLRSELERLGHGGQLIVKKHQRDDVEVESIEHLCDSTRCEAQRMLLRAQGEGMNAAALKYDGGQRHQQVHETVVQKTCDRKIGSQLMRTEILPVSEDTLVLVEEVQNCEMMLTQELWSSEMQAMDKIACAGHEAIQNLQCCICSMVPRRNLLSAEEEIKSLEAMAASNVNLATEISQLKFEIISKDTQLYDMTLQVQASTASILGLHSQLKQMVPQDKLEKIHRDLDVLLAEVERLKEKAMGMVSVDALQSEKDALQAKVFEIECLHAVGHEELAGAKKQVMMLTETVSLLKLQLQEATAKTAEKGILLAMMNCTEHAAEAKPTRGQNAHCQEEVERMRLMIAEVSAVLRSCLESCLADVDWLLLQTESVIKIDSESVSVDQLESDSRQELNKKELCGCEDRIHIDLSWGCRSPHLYTAVLAVVLFFFSLRFDAPAIVVV